MPIEHDSGTTLENERKKLCQMAKELKMNWDHCQTKMNFKMQQLLNEYETTSYFI